MASVKVAGLSKSFGSNRVIDNVSFEVPSGRVLSLLGPSGCGKTTILRCIAGLEVGSSGSIAIGDRQVFRDGRTLVPAEDRNVGMMFQSYAIWPHMTIFENVAFGLKVRNVPTARIKDRVKEVLALVRMANMDSRYPGQLSGGQMQRVVLARSIAYDPALLLLDEPLANLDTNLREEMRGELKRVQRETGATMIAVTHDQGEALALSDEILVMDSGHVLQRGAPAEIFERPATPQIARFLGASNVIQGRSRKGVAPTLAEMVATADTTTPSQGDVFTLCFRPTDVRVVDQGGPGAIPATIESFEYLGQTTHYLLRSPFGSLQAATIDGPGRRQVGDQVALVVEPSRIMTYPGLDA